MIASALKKLIRAYYYLVSPLLGSRCRYVPSCSEYALQAVDQHGAFRGSWLATKRICRCHPWGGEGFDPVPKKPGSLNQTVKNNTESETK